MGWVREGRGRNFWGLIRSSLAPPALASSLRQPPRCKVSGGQPGTPGEEEWRSGRRPGFTLIEIITVLTIMIIVLAVAIPVWNVITGGHSLAAAQNQIASVLATARSDAIYNQQTTGIFFFVDPATGQVAMAEVQCDPQAGGGTTYTPANSASNPNAGANGAVNALEMVNDFIPNNGFAYRRDLVLLPVGVGVALCNNTYGYTYGGAVSYPFDRYVRLGAIMFDATGMLTSISFAIPVTRNTPYPLSFNHPPNQLGKRLGLTTTIGDLASNVPHPPGTAPPYPPASGFYPLTSQVGLLLYDRDAFLGQRTTNTTTPGVPFTDDDMNYQLPGHGTASPANKADEENWLDQNGIASLVSPFNGALIKAK